MSESDIVIWPGGLIGYKRVQVGVEKNQDGKETPTYNYVSGALLAMRDNGNEILFARSDEDSRDPAEWIHISTFVVNPVAVATEEDFYEEEEEPLPGGVDLETEEHSPMEQPKRPRVNLNVLRREPKP